MGKGVWRWREKVEEETMEKIIANGVSEKLLIELSREELERELELSEEQADSLEAIMKEEEYRLASVKTWSEEEVAEWLGTLGTDFAAYEDSFLFHNVNGDLLLDLTADDLIEELGVDKLGHRMRILEEIAYLKKICYKSARGSKNAARNQSNLPSFDEIENLKRQKAVRLQGNLDVLKHKVNQMRDAEAKAKLLARQAEAEAGRIQRQLRKLKTEPKEQGMKVNSSKRGVVRGWMDQCTFKPKLNPASLEMVENNFGDSDFHRRLESQKEKKFKELQKSLSADNTTELRKKYMKYFNVRLGWDTRSGIQQSYIDSFLANPGAYDVKLSDNEIIRLQYRCSEVKSGCMTQYHRALKGAKQHIAIYNSIITKDFLTRNDEKRPTRQRKANTDGKQGSNPSKPKTLDQYFTERFKWKEVDNGRLDDLLDNSKAYELELSEQQLARLRELEFTKKKKAIFRALQTQSFLKRNAADMRRREIAQQKAFQQLQSALGEGGGRSVVQSFLERYWRMWAVVAEGEARYHQDMETRHTRKLALVDKVKKEDPNFKECTFRPNLHVRVQSPELETSSPVQQTA